MLELRDVHVYRGATYVLKGVSMAVAPGEIVALIGANGAGKSTMLAAISRLIAPTNGEILYRRGPDAEWTDLTRLAPEELVRRGLSHCPEGRQIFGDLSVRENLMVGAYLRRDKAAIGQDLARIHELFPVLAERAAQPGDLLSGGEQMMLAIGRALMSRPRLLLLDEPSLGLAPRLVEQVDSILRRIREEGVTVLLVEQNAAMALELADRGYVLETGEINLSGTGHELRDNEAVRKAYLGAA